VKHWIVAGFISAAAVATACSKTTVNTGGPAGSAAAVPLDPPASWPHLTA
jgi:hypothetical protein